MGKTFVGVLLGLALVAGQAVAAAQPAMSRVSDRVSAELGRSSAWGSNTLSDRSRMLPPLPVAIIGTTVIIAAIFVAVDDASESE